MIKSLRNKCRFVSFLLFFIIGLAYLKFYFIDQNEQIMQPKSIISDTSELITKKKEQFPSDYVAILEIPSIRFKHGLFKINDPRNDVNYNPEILKESIMPDTRDSLLIIAAHSGRGNTAFFNNLDQVKVKDEIYFYYQNRKYIYKIETVELQNKTGQISITSKNHQQLILTTCAPNLKDKQLVVEAQLVSIVNKK